MSSSLLWLCAAVAYGAELPRQLSNDDFIAFDAKQAQLGQLLFYDKILSGNRNISCGTCHHHKFGGADGLSLGIGEGGEGIGPQRTAGTGDNRIRKRIPRNAPALWNLGAKEISVLFHDGRLTKSDLYENGFNSPAEEWLPKGLSNLLAAQAMLPMTAQFEMAGNPKENQVAGAAHDRIDKVWPILAKRVRTIPTYGAKFVDAFDHVKASKDVTMVEIAEALAAFIGTEWKSFDAPFDEYLAGNKNSLSNQQKLGLNLFFGKGNCSSCHSGPLFSDQKFYALALPPFGPGRTRQFDPIARDVGHMGESDRIEDAYRFRTPALRNITLTGPYGHNGAYPTLAGIIGHHTDPIVSLKKWTRDLAKLPKAPWLEQVDFASQQNSREMTRIKRRIDIKPTKLSSGEISDLVSFMRALEGRTAQSLPLGRPTEVPSGLSVD